ncbi:MAG: TetR/AcrR family transcriptional regulator [Vicinamibacteria bacterium]
MRLIQAGSVRKPRADGLRSRKAILDTAVLVASVDGIAGLTIGGLAERLGMSKSGLYAHFGSKEELELAVVEHAAAIYRTEVLAPSLAAPAGVARLVAHAEAFLSYVSRRVFPGGCFFLAAAAEFDARTGPVRDAIAEVLGESDRRVADSLRDAVTLGELPDTVDVAQTAFELGAVLAAANAGALWTGSREPIERARVAVERLLTHAAAS